MSPTVKNQVGFICSDDDHDDANCQPSDDDQDDASPLRQLAHKLCYLLIPRGAPSRVQIHQGYLHPPTHMMLTGMMIQTKNMIYL